MKILMNHIPKCAGNAVALHFKALLGAAATYEIRTNGGIDAVPDLAPYDFVFGHLPMRWEDQMGVGRQRFSLMRDPVDRVLSAYFFYLQLKQDNSAVVADVPVMTLEEYVTSEDPLIKATTCNEQARHLLGLEGIGTRDPREAVAYVAERAPVLERFFMVGVHERLQDSLDVISWHLGLPRLSAGLVDNPTHRKWKQERFDPATLDLIRDRNLIDLELYRIVGERFARQRGMMMDDLLVRHYFDTHEVQPQLPCVVPMDQPVTGSGWYGVQTDAPVPYRWMGGGAGASLYFPVAAGGALTVRVHMTQILPAVDRNGITIFLDGRKLRTQLQPGPDGLVLVGLAENVVNRKGHVLTLRTTTWREPTLNDGRTLAMAVTRVELSRD